MGKYTIYILHCTLQNIYCEYIIHLIFRDSSMVERTAVNRLVPGSSPGRGVPLTYSKRDI
jgi:hypothetical protein